MVLVSDPGIVVNPLQLKRQAQAGCLMGISEALHEEVSFDTGAVTSLDWSTYPILTAAEMPDLKVVIAPYAGAEVYGQGSEAPMLWPRPRLPGRSLTQPGGLRAASRCARNM
jgi:CO/xanthine dehydrogenase Mo-binding subunit